MLLAQAWSVDASAVAIGLGRAARIERRLKLILDASRIRGGVSRRGLLVAVASALVFTIGLGSFAARTSQSSERPSGLKTSAAQTRENRQLADGPVGQTNSAASGEPSAAPDQSAKASADEAKDESAGGTTTASDLAAMHFPPYAPALVGEMKVKPDQARDAGRRKPLGGQAQGAANAARQPQTPVEIGTRDQFGFRRDLALNIQLPGWVEERRFLALELVAGAMIGVHGMIGKWQPRKVAVRRKKQV